MARRTFLFKSSMGLDHYMIEDEDGTRFETIGHTDPVIEANKAMATQNDGYSPSRELRRVASIPFILINKWLQEEGWNALDPEHSDRLMRKLNSSEYAYLRTADGQLGMSNGVMR
jgi:hypothetical protein